MSQDPRRLGKALLFIPDICGFTEFVKEVELRHSKHIVTELLELLDDQNQKLFDLAEVEGDALFFYQEQDQIDSQDFLQLIKRMYSAFHQHLNLYRYKRVCNCGACTSASGLELKFIVHSGEIEYTDIKGKRKPFGPAVIEAHRLLKAKVEENEYVLLSKQVDSKISDPLEEYFAKKRSDSDHFDGEEIHYSIFHLEKNNGLDEGEMKFPQLSGIKAVESSMWIASSSDELYQYITDIDKRLEWSAGIQDIQFTDGQINKIDSVHTCVINDRNVEVKTIYASNTNQEKIYIEETRSIPNLEFITTIFRLKENGKGTELKVSAYIKPSNWIGKLTSYFIKKNLNRALLDSLNKIKEKTEKAN